MTLTLTHLLIATLVVGSAVTGLQVIVPSPAPASASSTPHPSEHATSRESVILVFPPNRFAPSSDRFAASSTGLKPVPPRIVRLTPVASN
jgi:hypothetical protein